MPKKVPAELQIWIDARQLSTKVNSELVCFANALIALKVVNREFKIYFPLERSNC